MPREDARFVWKRLSDAVKQVRLSARNLSSKVAIVFPIEISETVDNLVCTNLDCVYLQTAAAKAALVVLQSAWNKDYEVATEPGEHKTSALASLWLLISATKRLSSN